MSIPANKRFDERPTQPKSVIRGQPSAQAGLHTAATAALQDGMLPVNADATAGPSCGAISIIEQRG
jgi:hypothetical protein